MTTTEANGVGCGQSEATHVVVCRTDDRSHRRRGLLAATSETHRQPPITVVQDGIKSVSTGLIVMSTMWRP